MLKTGKMETSIHLIMIGWVHIKHRRERDRQRERERDRERQTDRQRDREREREDRQVAEERAKQ